MKSPAKKAPAQANPRDLTRSEIAYRRLKAAIFDFVLLPGDGFTESDMAERLGMSRTPVREALFRLELEGYVKVAYRSGWSVAPFDFRKLEELYDLRVVLECTAVDRLCAMVPMPDLGLLKAAGCAPKKTAWATPPKWPRSTRPSTPRWCRPPATWRWRACMPT
jgi:DNA-binding GntR family transcriptional regulator